MMGSIPYLFFVNGKVNIVLFTYILSAYCPDLLPYVHMHGTKKVQAHKKTNKQKKFVEDFFG